MHRYAPCTQQRARRGGVCFVLSRPHFPEAAAGLRSPPGGRGHHYDFKYFAYRRCFTVNTANVSLTPSLICVLVTSSLNGCQSLTSHLPPLLLTVPLGDGGDFTDKVTESPGQRCPFEGPCSRAGSHSRRSLAVRAAARSPPRGDRLLEWSGGCPSPRGPVRSPPRVGCGHRRELSRSSMGASERFPAGQILAF